MKNAMEYKGYFGTVEYSESDNILFGKVIGIGSLISYEGSSVDELRSDFEAAVDDYLELCAEKGIEPDKTYKGSFNVRISPELHRSLALYSASHNQSLNASVEAAIEYYISAKA
ncbi:MAG: type II toxin-antitoxin system HicB family antitoxin [Oscillospiraceae bacterium]